MAKADLKVAASTEIKIHKGIPIPAGGGPTRYPWHEMEVGDCFDWPHGKDYAYTTARVASARYAPKKFVARMVDGVTRIWRES